MSRHALALSLLVVTAGVTAADEPPDVGGVWEVAAGGTVRVTRALQGEQRYHVAVRRPAGAFEGVGLLRDGRLAVGWGKRSAGVMVARRDAQGWSGEWTIPEATDERLGREVWIGAPLEGAHDLKGTNPNGTTYVGRVTLERRGEVLHVRWTLGNAVHAGVAVELGDDQVAVSFGDADSGLTIYTPSDADGLEARTCVRDGDRLELEQLRRGEAQAPPASPEREVDVREPTGRWQIDGGGALQVTAVPDRARYDLLWDRGERKVQGVAIVRGRWLIAAEGPTLGVLVARRAGEEWRTEWIPPHRDRPGSELWHGAALEGVHALAGTNPSGSRYEGQVTITRRGELFRLAWVVGGHHSAGVGLALEDDVVAAAYADRGLPTLIVYDLASDGAVEGRRCTPDGDAVQVERLRRP